MEIMADEKEAGLREDVSNGNDQAVQKGAPRESGAPSAVPPGAPNDALAESVGLVLPKKAPRPAPIGSPPLSPEHDKGNPLRSIDPSAPLPEAPVTGAPVPQSQPAPGSAPTSPFTSAPGEIARILKEAQLPERLGAASKEPPPKNTYDTTLAGSEPSAPHAAPPTNAESAAHNADSPVVAMHTLKQDLQSVVRQDKISLVRATALEQQKRRPEPLDTPAAHTGGRAFGILFASVLLVVLGAAALGGVYFVMVQQSGTPAAPMSNSLIFAERSLAFSISGTPRTVKQSFATVRSSSGATLGSITRVVPVVAPAQGQAVPEQQQPREATFVEFLASMEAQAPGDLLRSLSPEFFLGIHVVDENAPVLIIPITDYGRAFAGMLAWETTMNADLAPLFTPVPALTGEGGLVVSRTFTDLVMRNYDVRALSDDGGTIQLYYSFPTRELLVIAESPYSFTEILSRLQAERRL